LPMREAWALAASADCGVSPIPPGPLFDVSSPTKLVEYLALGLPAVATRIPDQEKVLRESGAGLCVEFSATELARAIALVLGDPSGWRDLARNGRAYIADHRSYSALSELVAQRLLGLRVRPQSPPGEKSGQATG
jgi:glycosyltransferase involved in cell wall biosynthesis